MSVDRQPVGPTFLMIGAARSGTTAMIRFLAQHPDVFVTDPKEPHFFAFANQQISFAGPGDDETINRRLINEPSRYRELYDGAVDRPVRGEGSVSTLCHPESAVANIERYAPEAKLLVLLRDPVERAFSSYLYLRSRDFEALPTFEEGLAAEDRRRAAGYHHMWWYRRLGEYATQLDPFVRALGRDRLLVVRHEAFAESPTATMRAVTDFLGLSPFAFDTSVRVNAGGEPRSRVLTRTMRSVRRSDLARQAVRSVTSSRMRERVRSVNLDRPELPSHVGAQLRSAYADEIERLEGLLDLDLTSWKGDP